MTDQTKSAQQKAWDQRVNKLAAAYLIQQDLRMGQKQAASGDPYWLTAKYPGKSKDGTPVRKGDKVLYWPRTKTMMVGPKADQAWREFQSQVADDDFYNRMAADPVALTKMQVIKLMKQHKVPGEVSGQGAAWEVELPDEKALKLFRKYVTKAGGGYKSGYGSWVLSPGYKDKGDWGDPSSAWHYASKAQTGSGR